MSAHHLALSPATRARGWVAGQGSVKEPVAAACAGSTCERGRRSHAVVPQHTTLFCCMQPIAQQPMRATLHARMKRHHRMHADAPGPGRSGLPGRQGHCALHASQAAADRPPGLPLTLATRLQPAGSFLLLAHVTSLYGGCKQAPPTPLAIDPPIDPPLDSPPPDLPRPTLTKRLQSGSYRCWPSV